VAKPQRIHLHQNALQRSLSSEVRASPDARMREVVL
jgi:hypothetical protein